MIPGQPANSTVLGDGRSGMVQKKDRFYIIRGTESEEATEVMFEFDQAKSDANKRKHGIDFSEAQALWRDANQLRVAARTGNEARFVVVGLIGGKHWSAVITYRAEAVRLISVRRSRNAEVRAYEGK